MTTRFVPRRIPTAELTVGYSPGYIADVASYDLDGMEFRVLTLEGPFSDMSDDSVEFYCADVEVGSEVWNGIILPADADFAMIPPEV